MTYQHTPGPWHVIYYDAGDEPHRDHNGPCPSISAPDDQDCDIVHWDGFKQRYWSSANGNQKQIEANARLIAAAPELLEALESLFLQARDYKDFEMEYPDEFIRAQRALTKAKGG